MSLLHLLTKVPVAQEKNPIAIVKMHCLLLEEPGHLIFREVFLCAEDGGSPYRSGLSSISGHPMPRLSEKIGMTQEQTYCSPSQFAKSQQSGPPASDRAG